jgi:hypothetical protein
MSKSFRRVLTALSAAGIPSEPVELGECRTARQAAAACLPDRTRITGEVDGSNRCGFYLNVTS